jgi:cysteine-rich repeat protein
LGRKDHAEDFGTWKYLGGEMRRIRNFGMFRHMRLTFTICVVFALICSLVLVSSARAAPVCGNGLVETGEGCDDSNTASGDGCSATCTVENGYICSGSPSVCAPGVGYAATVLGVQNTVIQSSNGAFGPIYQGGFGIITSSVVLSNTGGAPAKVEARFATSTIVGYGLRSSKSMLLASNFEMGPTGTLVALHNDGTNVPVATVPVGTLNLDAKLTVPSDQAPGTYDGNVILTFSNA